MDKATFIHEMKALGIKKDIPRKRIREIINHIEALAAADKNQSEERDMLYFDAHYQHFKCLLEDPEFVQRVKGEQKPPQDQGSSRVDSKREMHLSSQ